MNLGGLRPPKPRRRKTLRHTQGIPEAQHAFALRQGYGVRRWSRRESNSFCNNLISNKLSTINGFQLMEKVGEVTFHVVFITAYDKYAVRAFRFSALDYLLKPVDTIDLVAAVKKAEELNKINPQQLDLLRQYYAAGIANTPKRIALPYSKGVGFVEVNEIIYCESDSNYTRCHLKNGEQYLVSKTLGDIQDMLESLDFVRVHRQYLVNLSHIQKLVKGEGTYLILSNGIKIPYIDILFFQINHPH